MKILEEGDIVCEVSLIPSNPLVTKSSNLFFVVIKAVSYIQLVARTVVVQEPCLPNCFPVNILTFLY